jgi:molybdopterin molybdotransferase
MHEQCLVEDRRLFIQGHAGRALHIRRRGEDFAAGDLLLSQGARLRPQDLGLLAAAGINHVAVRPRLRVGILSTGNELCDGGKRLHPGAIFDANRVMLCSFCKTLNMEVTDLGIVGDDRREIATLLARAAKTYDVVIASAGTSQGEGDHLADAVVDWGSELILSGVAIKPGKPVMFGKIGKTPLICLPGNPVAAITTFLVLALPVLRRLMGERHIAPKWISARAQFAHRKKRGLREYLRVTVGSGPDGALVVEKLSKQGSAMLTSLAACDGFVCLDESVTDIAAGTMLPYCAISEFC